VKGRLNLFQAMMLRWRELHPYNAVHVVRIDRPLDTARLAAIVDGHLEGLGLTGFALDIGRARFEYAGGPAGTVLAIHAGGDLPLHVLEREIERELNLPFPRDGRFVPFRFFAVDEGPRFHLGLTYDHFIAAGDSVVVLMRGLYERYCADGADAARMRPLDRYPATCGRLFLRHIGPTLRGIPRTRAIAASCRRSVRPRCPDGSDRHNAFAHFRLDAGELAGLVGTARAWGVTVNDLLLAILLQVLEPFAGERPPTERRRELGVASIVSLRRDFGTDPETTFGQFLSSFRISHPLPPGIQLSRLAHDVHAETARIKREKLYLQSLFGVAGSGVMWRFLTRERRDRFYAKNYPVWGAITMVDVDPLWARAAGLAPPPAYRRAVPTGPLAPLVVAVTTAAGLLDAGISYRRALFSVADVDRMAEGFVACVRRIDR